MISQNTLTLSRADLALVLLAEVAFGHDEVFRAHLPLLFHVVLVSMDSVEMEVRGGARAAADSRPNRAAQVAVHTQQN
eukprot:1192903-Prorocentrum_minimum.AAC.2